ncbi:MAG TPA: Spo0E family sporulation regulatory protein-aspartic acid phosphatase [Candidatus Choladousia intestinigallinarum]|nr:Spo0E family sporulation regulatory protein-aspartic acid phosphatase [Candidatus Choladousia intestinigallinarum]
MNQREILREQIEKERTRLNSILESGGKVEEVYEQSLVVDRLLEQYMTDFVVA